jgi:hypothetical protein
MTLRNGAWNMNNNGQQATLNITNVADTGLVDGNMLTGALSGLWDETSRTLSFLYVDEHLVPWFYKGFLFSTPQSPTPGQDVVWTLSGSFQITHFSTLTSLGGNARRSVFGWYAQVTEVA